MKISTWSIYNENGKLIININEIIETWKKYCEKLYTEKKSYTAPYTEARGAQHIIRGSREVTKLIHNKSSEIDCLMAEVYKARGPRLIQIIHQIC